MSETTFYKMTGSGNDFIMLDGRATTGAAWPAARITDVCDRRRGIGADGLVILTPDERRSDAVQMAFFNSDGSRAAMCGNAALCSTRLSAHLGLVPAGEMTLLTDAGEVRTRLAADADQAEIDLGLISVPVQVPAIPLAAGERSISFTTVGVPHLVIRVDDVELVPLATRGRELRFHPNVGPDGANANFISAPDQPGEWLIRTYERGVEGETLACGTGTVAAALALAVSGEATLPIRFRTRSGEPLTVSATIRNGQATDVWLRGQGKLVFRGLLQNNS